MGGLRVELGEMIPDLWSWANTQAAAEEIPVGALVCKALDAYRRSIEGGPRQNPRTRKVGRRGAAAQMREGEYLSTEIRALAHAVPADIGRWRRAGCIVPLRPTSTGIAAAYGDVDLGIARVLVALRACDVDELTVADAIRSVWHATRGKFVVAGAGGACHLVSEAHVGARARDLGVATVVSLEHVHGQITRARMEAA